MVSRKKIKPVVRNMYEPYQDPYVSPRPTPETEKAMAEAQAKAGQEGRTIETFRTGSNVPTSITQGGQTFQGEQARALYAAQQPRANILPQFQKLMDLRLLKAQKKVQEEKLAKGMTQEAIEAQFEASLIPPMPAQEAPPVSTGEPQPEEEQAQPGMFQKPQVGIGEGGLPAFAAPLATTPAEMAVVGGAAALSMAAPALYAQLANIGASKVITATAANTAKTGLFSKSLFRTVVTAGGTVGFMKVQLSTAQNILAESLGNIDDAIVQFEAGNPEMPYDKVRSIISQETSNIEKAESGVKWINGNSVFNFISGGEDTAQKFISARKYDLPAKGFNLGEAYKKRALSEAKADYGLEGTQ